MVRRYREPVQPSYGWFRYKNISGGDLLLQRPLKNGVHLVGKDFYFEGDSFYKNHDGVKLIACLSDQIAKGQEEFKRRMEEAKAKSPQVKVERVKRLSHKEMLRQGRLQKEARLEKQRQQMLLIEEPEGSLDFYTDERNTTTPLPASPSDLLSESEGNEPGITKKELLEFAAFKGITVNPNWSKEKILKAVRG